MCTKMPNIVLVTGGFDPVHSGHISYLKEARSLGYRLIVGLNSDEWLIRKKGKFFLPFEERAAVLGAIQYVSDVISFNDDDGTSNDAIDKLLGQNASYLLFANGGDRSLENTPEYLKYGDHPWMKWEFNVGGEKTNSSSDILNNYVQKSNDVL